MTVEIHIYKGRGSDWILEVVDAARNSHVWDEQFQTDQQAFDEAMRALDEEPLECWRRPKTEPLLRVVPTQN